ncbi:MAG: metal dependent phosphohydrolase, partial [Streptosporangiaceae bacterium]|nr:metal dependent phosphohydrolase [Streptosporangiaceae bacterium]
MYVCGVVITAAALPAMSPYEGLRLRTWIVLALLFVLLDSVPARLTLERARVSMSYAAGLASVVLLGPVGAALVGATAMATGQRIGSPIKRLFNGAQFALCGYTAGTVYKVCGGMRYQPAQPHWVEHAIGPFAAALVTYVAVNLLLAAGVLLLSRQATWWELVRDSGQLSVGILGYGSMGMLIAGLWPALGPVVLVLLGLPLVMARSALAQTRAQHQAHEATLAALCQAVETKDYYTRGHSERVSRGSVMIAQEIGMRPER